MLKQRIISLVAKIAFQIISINKNEVFCLDKSGIHMFKRLIFSSFFTALFLSVEAQQNNKVIIVTLDGLRWQELFRGADSSLINSRYNDQQELLMIKYWHQNKEIRRKLLMPFIWNIIAKNGQLIGNRDLNSKMSVKNSSRLSYPGYSELFTGYVDPEIKSNDRNYNKNLNIFEFLNQQKPSQIKAASFTSWDVFPYILNKSKATFLINSGIDDLKIDSLSNEFKLLNNLQHQAPPFVSDQVRLDVITYQFAKQYLKEYKPRLLHIGLDESDDMAHAENYKFYIEQTNKADLMLHDLWEYLQKDLYYKDQTTLIVTTDHGRGEKPFGNWTSHGKSISGSEQTWLAVIGPSIPAKGEVKNSQEIYAEQMAQTISSILSIQFSTEIAGHSVAKAIDLK